MIGFDDIDPHFDDTDTGPGADNETIARAVRLLRYLRRDKAELDECFKREQERLTQAWLDATGPTQNRIESVERLLAGWLEWRQGVDAATGRKVRKSAPFPDGRISSRASSRVDVDDGADPETFHPNFRRIKVEVDRQALAAAVRGGRVKVLDDGTLVSAYGDLMPARWVESTSYTITTTEDNDDT